MFTPKKYSQDDIFACYRTRKVYLNEFNFGPLYTEEPFLASIVELTRHPDLQAKIKTGSNRKKLSEGKDRRAIDIAIMKKERSDIQEKMKKEETASVTSKSDSKQSQKSASSDDENNSNNKIKGKSSSQSSLHNLDDTEAKDKLSNGESKPSEKSKDEVGGIFYPNVRVEKVQKYKPTPLVHEQVINEQKFDEKGNLKYTIKTYKLGTSLQREQKTLIPKTEEKKEEKIQEIIPPKPRPKIDMTKDSLMPDFVPTRLVDSISSLTPDTRIMVNDPFEGIHMPKRTNRAPLSIFMPKKNLPPSAARNNILNNNSEEIEVQKPQQKPIKAEKKEPENNKPTSIVVQHKDSNKIQIINNQNVPDQKQEKKPKNQQLKKKIIKSQQIAINNVQKQKNSEQEKIPEPESIKESIKEQIKEPEPVQEPEPEPVHELEIEHDPELVNNGKKSGKKKKMSAAQKKLLKKMKRKSQQKESFEEEEDQNPYEAPRPFIPDIPEEMRSETEIRSNPHEPPKIDYQQEPLIQQIQDDDQISEQFLEQEYNNNYPEQKEEIVENISQKESEEIIQNNSGYTEVPTKKIQTKIINNSQFIIPQQEIPESVPTVQQRSVITLKKVIKLKKVIRGNQVIDVKQEVVSSMPANVAKTKLLSKAETERRRQEQLQELKKLYDQTTTTTTTITNETEEKTNNQEDVNLVITDRKSKRSKPSPPRQQPVWNQENEENEEDEIDLDNLDLPMMAALQNQQQNKDKSDKIKAEMAAKGIERFDEVDIAGMHLTFAPRKSDHSVYYGVDIADLGPEFTPSNIIITEPLKLHGPSIEHILEERKERLASILIPREYLKDRMDTPEIASIKREIRKKLREAALAQRVVKSAYDLNADFVREMGRSKEINHKQVNNLKYTAYPQGYGYSIPQQKQNNVEVESFEDVDFGWETNVRNNFNSFNKLMEDERLNPIEKIKVVQQSDTSILDNLGFGPKPSSERKVAIKILGPVDDEEQKIKERRKEFKIVPKRGEYKQRMEEAERNKPDTTMFNNLMAEEAENAKKKQSKIRYSPERKGPSEFDLLMQDEANKTQTRVSTLRPKQKTIWDSVTVVADPVEKTVEEEIPGGKTWGLTFKPKPAEKQKTPLQSSRKDDGDDYYGQTRKSFFETLMEEEQAKADAEKAARRLRNKQNKGVSIGQQNFNSILQDEERRANELEEETIVDLNETEQIPPHPMNNAPKLVENDDMFWGVEEQFDTKQKEVSEEPKQIASEKEEKPSRKERKRRGKSNQSPGAEPPKQQSSSGWDSLSAFQESDPLQGVSNLKYTRLTKEERAKLNAKFVLKTVAFRSKSLAARGSYKAPEYVPDDKDKPVLYEPSKQTWGTIEIDVPEDEKLKAKKDKNKLTKVVKIDDDGLTEWGTKRKQTPIDFNLIEKTEINQTSAKRRSRSANHVTFVGEVTFEPEKKKPKYAAPSIDQIVPESPKLENEIDAEKWVNDVLGDDKEDKKKYPLEEFSRQKRSASAAPSSAYDDPTNWGATGNEDEMMFFGLQYKPKKFHDIIEIQRQEEEMKKLMFHKITRSRNKQEIDTSSLDFSPSTKNRALYEPPTIDSDFDEPEPPVETNEKFSQKQTEKVSEKIEKSSQIQKEDSINFDEIDLSDEEQLIKAALTYKPKPPERKKVELPKPSKWMSFDFDSLLVDHDEKKRSQSVQPVSTKQRIAALKANQQQPEFQPKQSKSKFEAPSILAEEEPKHEEFDDSWYEINDPHHVPFSGLRDKQQDNKESEFDKLLKEEKTKHDEATNLSFKPKQTSSKYEAPEVVSERKFGPKEKSAPIYRHFSDEDEEESTKEEVKEEKNEWDNAKEEFTEDLEIDGLKYEPKKEEKKESEFDKLLQEEKSKKEEATNVSFKPKEKSSKYEAPEVVSDEEILPKRKPEFRKFFDSDSEEEDKEQKKDEAEVNEWDNAKDEFTEDLEIDILKYEPKKEEKKETEFDKLLQEEKTKKEETTNVSFKPKEKSSKFEAPEVVSDEEILPKRKPEFRKFFDSDSEEEENKDEKQTQEKSEWEAANDGFTEDLEIDGLKYEPKKESEFDLILLDEQTKKDDLIRVKRSRSPAKTSELPSFKPKETAAKYEAPEIVSDQEKIQSSKEKIASEHKTTETDEWNNVHDDFGEDLDISGMKYEPKNKEEEKIADELEKLKIESVSEEFVQEEQPKKSKRARSPAKATESPSFKPKETSSKYDAPEIVSDQEKVEETIPVPTEEEKPMDEWAAAAEDNFDEDIDIYGLKYVPKKEVPTETESNKKEKVKEDQEQPKKVERSRPPAKTTEVPSFKPKETGSKYDAPEIVSDQEKPEQFDKKVEEEEEEVELNDVLELSSQVISNDDWDNLDNFAEDDIEIEGLKYQPKEKQEFNKLLEEEKAISGQTEAVLENTTFKPKQSQSKTDAPSIDQLKKEKKIKDFNEIQTEEEETIKEPVTEEVIDEWNNNETFTEELEIDGLKYEPKPKTKKDEMKYSDEFNKLIEEENKAEKLKEQQLKPAFTPKSKQHKYEAPEIVNDQKETKKPVYKDFNSDEEKTQEEKSENKEQEAKDEWEDIHEEFQEENYPIDGLKYVPKSSKISPEQIIPSDKPKISDFDRIMMQEEKKRSSSPQPVSFQKKKQQQTKITIDLPSFNPSNPKKSNYEAPEVTEEQIKVETEKEEKPVDEWNEPTFDEGLDYDGLRYIPNQQKQYSVEKPSKQKPDVKFTEKPQQEQKEQKKEFNTFNAAAGEFAGDMEEKKESNYVVKPIDIKPKQIRSTSPSARQGKKLFEELLDEEKKLREKELEEKQRKQKEMLQKVEIYPGFSSDNDEFLEEGESSRAKLPIDILRIVKSPTYLSEKKTIIKDLFPPGFEPGTFVQEEELPPDFEEQTNEEEIKPIQPEQIIRKEQPKKEEKTKEVKPLKPEQIVVAEKKENEQSIKKDEKVVKEQPTEKEEVQLKKVEKVSAKPMKEENKSDKVKTEKVSQKPEIKQEKNKEEQPIKKVKETKPTQQEKVVREQPKKVEKVVEEKPIKKDKETKPEIKQPIQKVKEETKQEKIIKEQAKKEEKVVEEKPISPDLSKLQKFIIKNEKIIDNDFVEKKKRSVSPPPFAVRAKPTKKKVIKTKTQLPEENVHAKVPLPLKSLPDDFDIFISSDMSSNMLISDSDMELPDNLFGNDTQLFKESSGSDDKFSDGPMFESADELPMSLLNNDQQITKQESIDNIKEKDEEEHDEADNEEWILENDEDDLSPFEFENKSSPVQKEIESSNSMEEDFEIVKTKKVPVLIHEEIEVEEESNLLANDVMERVKKSANKKRSSSPQPVSFQKTKKFLESKEIIVPLQQQTSTSKSTSKQNKKQQNISDEIIFEEQPKTELKPIEPSQFMIDESQVSKPPKQKVEEELVKTSLEEIKQSMIELTEKPSKKQNKSSKSSQPSFKPKSQTKKMVEPKVQEEQIKPTEKQQKVTEKVEKPIEKVTEKPTMKEGKSQKVTDKPIEKVTEEPIEKVTEKSENKEEKSPKVTEKQDEKVIEQQQPKRSESTWNMDSDDWGAAEFAEDDLFFGAGLVYKPNTNSANKQENKAKTNKKSSYAKSKSSFDTIYDDEVNLDKARKDREEATRVRDVFDEVDQLIAKKPTKSSVEIPEFFLTKQEEIAYKNKHGAVEVFDNSVDVINGFWGPIRVQPQTKTTFDIIDEEEKIKEEKVTFTKRQKQRSRSAAPTNIGFTPKKTETYQPPDYVPVDEEKKEKKPSIRELPEMSQKELDEIMSVDIPTKQEPIEQFDSWEAAENNIFNEDDDIPIIGRKYTPIEIKLNPARSRSLSKSDTNDMKFTAPILGKYVTTTFSEIMTEEKKIDSFNHSKYTQRSKSVMPIRRRKRDPAEPMPEVEFSPSHKSIIEAPTYESDQESPIIEKPKQIEIKEEHYEEEQQPEPQITWKVDSWEDFKSDQFNEDEDLLIMPAFYHPKPKAPKFEVAKRERKTQSRAKSEKPPRKLKLESIQKADEVLKDHKHIMKVTEIVDLKHLPREVKLKPTIDKPRVYDESFQTIGQDWGETPKQTTAANFSSLVADENERVMKRDAVINLEFEPHSFVSRYEPPAYDGAPPIIVPSDEPTEVVEEKVDQDMSEFDPLGVKAKVREYHDDIDNWNATDEYFDDFLLGRKYTPRKNDEYIQQYWDETNRAKVHSQRAKSELPRANKKDKEVIQVADPNIEIKWHVDPKKVASNMNSDFSKIMESEQLKAENEEKSERAKMVIDLDEEQMSEKVTKMIYRRKEKFVPLNDDEIKEFEEAIQPINERAPVSRIYSHKKQRPVLSPFTESINFSPEPIDLVKSSAPNYPYLAEDEENYKKEKIEADKKQMDEKLRKLEAEHKKEEKKKEFLKSKFFEEFNEWENASKLIFVEDPPPDLTMQQFTSEEYKPINISKKQQPEQPVRRNRQIRGPVKRGKVQVEEPEIELSFYDAPEEKEEPKPIVIKAPVLKVGGKNGPLQLPAKFLPPAVKIGGKKQVDQPQNEEKSKPEISAAYSVLDGIINPIPEPQQEQPEEPIIPITKLDEPLVPIGPKVNLFSPQKFERPEIKQEQTKPIEKSETVKTVEKPSEKHVENNKPVKELTVIRRKVKQQVAEPVPIVVKTEEKPNIEIPEKEKKVVPKKQGVIGAPTISFDELMKKEEKVAKGEEKEENIDIGWVQQQIPKSIPTVSVNKWVKPKKSEEVQNKQTQQRKPSLKKSQNKKRNNNNEENNQKLRFKPIMPLPIKRKEPVTDTSTYTRPVPMVEPNMTAKFYPSTLKYINEDGKLVVENMFSVPPPKKPSLSIRRTKPGTTEVETTVFSAKEEEEKKEVEEEIKEEIPTVELPEKEKLSVGKKPEKFDFKKWARNDEIIHNGGVEEEEIPDVTKMVPEKPKEEENIPNFWLDDVSPEDVALVEKEEEERKKQHELQHPKPEEIETSLPDDIKPVERPQTDEYIPTFEELEGKIQEEVSTPTEEAVEEKKQEEIKQEEEVVPEKQETVEIKETVTEENIEEVEIKPEEEKTTEETVETKESVTEEKVEEIKPEEEEKKEELSVSEKEEPAKVEEEEIKETTKTEEVKEEEKPTEEKEEKKEEQGKEEEEFEYEYVYEEEDIPEKEKGPSPEELMENFRKEAFKRVEERKKQEEEAKKREEELKIRRQKQLEKERDEAIRRQEELKKLEEQEEIEELSMEQENKSKLSREDKERESKEEPKKAAMSDKRSQMIAFQQERKRRRELGEDVIQEEEEARRKQRQKEKEEERKRVLEEKAQIRKMMEAQERERMRANMSAVNSKVNALFDMKIRVIKAEEKIKQQREEKLAQQRAERDKAIKQRQAILQAELERRKQAEFEKSIPKNKKKHMMEQLAKAAEKQRLREIQEEEERRRKEEEEIRISKMTEEEKKAEEQRKEEERKAEEERKKEEKKLKEEQRRRQYEEEQRKLAEEYRRKQEAILEEKRKVAEEMRRKFEEKMREKEEEQKRAEEMRKKAQEVMEKIIEKQDKKEAVVIDAHEEEIRRLQELADKKLEAKMRKRQRRMAKYAKRHNEDDALFESTSSSDEEEEEREKDEEQKIETTDEQNKKENEEIPTWNAENEEKKDLKIIPAKYTEKKVRNVIDIVDPTSQWTYDELTEQETNNSKQSFFSKLLLEEESLLKAKQKQKYNEPKDEMTAKMGDFDEIETGAFTWQSAKKDPTRDELRNVFQRISANNSINKSPQKKVGYMQRLSQSESRQILSKPNKDRVLVLSALLRANVADIDWDEFVESIYGRSRDDIVYALMSVTSKANAESIAAKFIEKFK